MTVIILMCFHLLLAPQPWAMRGFEGGQCSLKDRELGLELWDLDSSPWFASNLLGNPGWAMKLSWCYPSDGSWREELSPLPALWSVCSVGWLVSHCQRTGTSSALKTGAPSSVILGLTSPAFFHPVATSCTGCDSSRCCASLLALRMMRWFLYSGALT